MSIPDQLAPFLSIVPEWALLLATLVVSLALIFAGRKVVKLFAFLVVGIIGASIGGAMVAQYLAGSGSLGVLLGVIVGFFIGGLLGVVLVAVGIGVAVGYAAYLLTAEFVSGTTIPLIVGLIFFIIGVAFYGRILGVVTAIAGGLLFFDVILIYGFGPILSTIFAAALTIVGIWVQEGFNRRAQQPTPPKT